MGNLKLRALVSTLCLIGMALPACAGWTKPSVGADRVQFSRSQTSRTTQYVALSAKQPKFSQSSVVGGEQIDTIAGLVVSEWCYLVEVHSNDDGLYWSVRGDNIINREIPSKQEGLQREVFCTLADDSIFRIEFSAHPVAEYQVDLELIDICFKGADCEQSQRSE